MKYVKPTNFKDMIPHYTMEDKPSLNSKEANLTMGEIKYIREAFTRMKNAQKLLRKHFRISF